ncbi:tetratricopeptide repeat protein [Blastopirellula sp. J2-11]|uniref:tetratricopeptide repeat protein n=1 Tax=Blastopirellula sp. J2-11 TaxID=2943192 RepID=UPI0021CABE87|nr:tetratricopeptide repeat protein [Blastopirellula sp. J2-11]UUO05960.1 tetratricopeptide repeat protein [Blastopirellula sp. J2-11]
MTQLHDTAATFTGRRVAFLGKLAGMSRKDASALLAAAGAKAVERPTVDIDLLVIGENDLPIFGEIDFPSAAIQQAAADGRIEIIQETTLWERLGLLETQQRIQRLYTPAMLADLLGVSKAIIRRWQRRGLIQPVREVRKLPYFDIREVATAQRLAQLLAAGTSADHIERQLASLQNLSSCVDRPLEQLSIIVEGRNVLLRQGEGLIEPGGQMRIDFEKLEPDWLPELTENASSTPRRTPAALVDLAAEYEDAGRFDAAVEALEAAATDMEESAELYFQLAELYYRSGKAERAIERYAAAIDCEPEFVEARSNLACTLVELGKLDEAVTQFQAAIAIYPDYFDAQYHLARLLDQMGRGNEATAHWEACRFLAPDDALQDEAAERLAARR